MEPRVRYYCENLCNALREASRSITDPKMLTSRNVRESLDQSTSTSRDWEDNHGLHISFRMKGAGDEPSSDKAADCLSDQDEESLVQETYNEIRLHFGHGVRQTKPPIPSLHFLKKVYRIVRHPRQRPALKGLLLQAMHNDKKQFKKAWASLLYLTRVVYAVVTLVDLATKLRFTSIQFQQVPAAVAGRPTRPDRHPTVVLESMGHRRLSQGWRNFFQDTARVKEFIRLANSRKTVHGEVQLILHLEGLPNARKMRAGNAVLPYMGCSKKCCYFCELFRMRHGFF